MLVVTKGLAEFSNAMIYSAMLVYTLAFLGSRPTVRAWPGAVPAGAGPRRRPAGSRRRRCGAGEAEPSVDR